MPMVQDAVPEDAVQNKRHSRILHLVILSVVFAVSFSLWRVWKNRTSTPGYVRLEQADEAFRNGEYDRAVELAGLISDEDQSWQKGRLLAAQSAEELGKSDAALGYLRSLRRGNSELSAQTSYAIADAYRRLGHISEAVQEYEQILRIDPEHTKAHAGLIYLLAITGRRWECAPHYEHLLRTETFTLKSLCGMGAPDEFLGHLEYLKFCFERDPEDVAVRQGLAVNAFLDGDLAAGKGWLREVVDRSPDSFAAQAMLGEILVAEDESTFQKWHLKLPAGSDNHPDIWFVRGLWARRLGRNEVAARCFWETLGRAQHHRQACQHLGQILTSLEHPSAGAYVERARQLTELSKLIDEAFETEAREDAPLRRIIELMEQCGRKREAWAWALTGILSAPSADEFRQTAERLSAELPESDFAENRKAILTQQYDLSHYPDHRQLFREAIAQFSRETDRDTASIRFDEAADAGIRHVYFCSSDDSTVGVRLFETNGGGVGILDYDNDGWPDVYLTQGAEWTQGEQAPTESERYTDRFYRNQNGRFVDQTAATGLGCRGYGQGCTVADVNNDGFADLYVANIGLNHLYLNNGDGTFTDATKTSGLDRVDWTASCVVVDLNDDGFPDLYDVNYVTGPDVYTHLCVGGSCGPDRFQGLPDSLYISQGDGSFKLIEGATPQSDANGLGIIAAVIYESDRPCLLVANDRTANFFLRNSESDDEHLVRLENQGFVSGLAFNEFGDNTGSMGIAADDVDGNGLLDFFVTNFADESNTLYMQDPRGLFVGTTTQAGLRSASMPLVGWGTQFLDADLDGNPDLVVANGHVDDYQMAKYGYHMRPQFFRNVGRGRFEELAPDRIGEWFGRKFLGRGLARLDLNRDGRMDFIVSNIGEPASLMANRTTGHGRFLNLRLHARNSSRDAIGATVEIRTANDAWSKQLVAGDGFMASNERLIQFGIGSAELIESIRVGWPSGSLSTLHDIPADTTLSITENLPTATIWKDFVPASVSVELP